MTTQLSPPGNGKSNGSDDTAQPTALPINVLAQYLKDLSFESPRVPKSLMAGQPAPEVGVHVDVKVGSPGEGVFEVTLTMRVEAKAETEVVFLVEVSYAGLFTLPGLPPEHHRPVLLIEGPRLLFPFVRAIVAGATRDGGFPPLLVNPIDFADLYRRQAQGNA